MTTETEIKKGIFSEGINQHGWQTDSPKAALLITRKEGPAQNEIFSIQEGGPPLTDDMILGRKLYKKQSRLLGLYGGGEAELGSGSLVVFVIFLFTFAFKRLLFKIPTSQLWLAAK